MSSVIISAFEREKSLPESCHCENGGYCRVGFDGLECVCPAEYSGNILIMHDLIPCSWLTIYTYCCLEF